MKKPILYYRALLFAVLSLACAVRGRAQAQWEFDVVQHNYHSYVAGDLWHGISNTAKPIAAAIPVGIFITALVTKNNALRMDAYETVAALAVTSGLTFAIKNIARRPRPFVTDSSIFILTGNQDYSFPSGHVSVAAASAVSLIIATRKWYVAVPAVAWVACVGYSRIYMGEHYPTDVITGAVVGAGSAWACHWLRKKLFDHKKPKQAAGL